MLLKKRYKDTNDLCDSMSDLVYVSENPMVVMYKTYKELAPSPFKLKIEGLSPAMNSAHESFNA
jgi:hypothetical protein